MTCDNIDTITGNIPFAGKLGRGRVNLYRAITDTLPPSVRFVNYQFTSNGSSFIKPGDTVEIAGDFINYLLPTKQLVANISCNNPHINFIQSENLLGVINTMQTINNQISPFVFSIDEFSGYDEEVVFTIEFIDTLYRDKQYFKFTINPSYADIDTNRIALTIASNGKLGYNNFYPLQGSGFIYNHNGTLLYEAGIAIAQNSQKVSSCFQGQSDYKIYEGIHQVIPAFPADERWACEFSDSLAGNAILGLNVKLDAMEWNSSDKSEFVFLNYTFFNNNTDSLTNLYAGIFCDWDIANSYRNKTQYNSDLRLLYSWYTGQTNLYTGSKLLSSENGFHYAFDSIKTVNTSGQIIMNEISNAELYQALSTNRDAAGTSANGNDVASLVSYGPFKIAPHDSIKLSFVLLASNSLYNLETAANNAHLLYDSLYISSPEILNEANCFKIFPNPSNSTINILYQSNKATKIDINIYNLQGQNVYSNTNIKVMIGVNQITLNTRLLKGYYIVKLTTEESRFSKSLLIK